MRSCDLIDQWNFKTKMKTTSPVTLPLRVGGESSSCVVGYMTSYSDMRKDTNLPRSNFGGPQIAAKSAWSRHIYIVKICHKINKNCKNVPKMAKKYPKLVRNFWILWKIPKMYDIFSKLPQFLKNLRGQCPRAHAFSHVWTLVCL